ncbi:MAG: DUF11 domain-containing protein [Rubripirellula sp.]|nr:DUF11 domain-containing protein [Rubripirellula sp.]
MRSSLYFSVALVVSVTIVVGCASQQSFVMQPSQTPVALSDSVETQIVPIGHADVVDNVQLVGHQAACPCFDCQSTKQRLFSKKRIVGRTDATLLDSGVNESNGLTTAAASQFYDSQEFLRDGGDSGSTVVRLTDQSLKGLQPEDTIVHYKTAAGKVEIQASNQVALYAPRFRSVRQVSGAVAGGRAVGAAQMDRPVGTVKVDQPLPGLVMRDSVEIGHADVARGLDAMRDRERSVPVDAVQQVNVASNVMAALVNLSSQQAYRLQGDQKALFHQFANAAVTYQLDECLEVAVQNLRIPSLVRDQTLDGFTIYEFEHGHGRLQISKFADRDDAKPGDIVTFGIRIENVGDGQVNEVVVVDNLTTRLEYVPDSLECEESVDFQTDVNEAQSLRLQWTLQEPLEVGEAVTIQFKCRVR